MSLPEVIYNFLLQIKSWLYAEDHQKFEYFRGPLANLT